MSILIRGMDMPKSCLKCDWCAHTIPADNYICYRLNRAVIGVAEEDVNETVNACCPLIPVPPHGRLGDLDKLEQMFIDIDNAPYSGFDGEEPFYSAEDAAQIIRLTPTIIPAAEEGET